MKKIILLILLFFGAKLNAQVTISPAFPSAAKEITITVDLTKVKNSTAAGMLNKTDDVYLWAWAGTTEDRTKAEISPPGQTAFNMPFPAAKMTSLGSNIWQIKFIPKDFYKTDKVLKWIGFLVKNGNGTSQTEDFIQTIFDGALQVTFVSPSTKAITVDKGKSIAINARASEKSKITLILDDKIELAKVASDDSIVFNYTPAVSLSGKHTITAKVESGANTATDQFSFYVTPILVEKPYGQPLSPGLNYFANGKVVFSFIAPLKKFVHLIGEFNNWQLDENFIMNKTGDMFWYELSGIAANKETAYQYLIEANLAVADPYSEKILDPNNDSKIPTETFPNLKVFPEGAKGIVSTFEIGQKPYDWKVTNFKKPAQKDLVIYELLVRDFSDKGNYKAVIDSVSYLKRLGVNCLELMPIMEFSGNDSWGYNPIFYTAVDKAYGTKNDLKALIDKCHQNGIAVVLDMVLNQADYEFPYVKMYWDGSSPSADSPFFNVAATHPFSVFQDFNHESKFTKELVKNVNNFWLREFKFDGFRFDLSKGFTQKKSGSDVGLWGLYDQSRIDIWKKINADIKLTDPTAIVILEHFADPNEEAVLAADGMLLWGNENGGFKTVVAGGGGSFYNLNYKNRQMATPSAVNYMESHDEERIAVKALKEGLNNNGYDTKNILTFLERQKAATALLMFAPGPKMIWQFGEFGYDVSIDLNSRTGKKPTKWEYLKDADRLKLMKVYGELAKVKTNNSFLNAADFNFTELGNVKYWSFNGSEKAVIVANLNLITVNEKINYPEVGDYYDLFTGEKVVIDTKEILQRLKPGEFHVYTSKKYAVSDVNLVPWAAFTKGSNVLAFEEKNSSIKAFPNPVADFVTLQCNVAGNKFVRLSVINTNGTLMQESTTLPVDLAKGVSLNLSHLRAGVYYIMVNDDSKMYVKIFKN